MIELRANDTPIATVVAFSDENPPATEPANTVASIVDVSAAATVTPCELMSSVEPPSMVAPMESAISLKAKAPAPVNPTAELLLPEIATAAASTDDVTV